MKSGDEGGLNCFLENLRKMAGLLFFPTAKLGRPTDPPTDDMAFFEYYKIG